MSLSQLLRLPTMAFPRKLVRLRRAKGMSQQALAYASACDDLKRQFEAASRLPEEKRKIARALLEGLIFKCEARRWERPATPEIAR